MRKATVLGLLVSAGTLASPAFADEFTGFRRARTPRALTSELPDARESRQERGTFTRLCDRQKFGMVRFRTALLSQISLQNRHRYCNEIPAS